ncbi:MAG: pilus assembly protein PilB [Geobacter sp.]|nr:pilus assembly protein PilB [Geobacter sp.]
MSINAREGTLGAILYNSRIISETDITAALEEQQRSSCRFGEALVTLGIVTQEDIDWALSNQLDIPYIRLKQDMIDPEALHLLPARLCRMHQMIPLIKAGDELSIAIADPLNKEAVAAAAEISGCRINLSVALIREINEMLDRCYGLPKEDLLGFSSNILSPDQLASINADSSGQQLINSLLAYSIQHQLASFSFRPLENQITISARNGATSHELGQLTPEHYAGLCTLIRKAAGLLLSNEPSQNGCLFFQHHEREICFQILLLQGTNGDYITIRQHISTTIPARLDQLQLPNFQKQQFRHLAAQRQGMILFASRSLQERCRFMDLLLEELDTDGQSVLILGSEPGRMIKSFPRIPLSGSESAKGRLIMDCLEHGPDILVIEDGTALESFTAAGRAAMRGKLVLVGMDIRGTRNLCDHLIRYRQRNAFLPPFLSGIVSFKGIQLLCPSCRQSYPAPDQELFKLHLQPPPTDFFHATGCRQCGFTGISERMFLTDIICFDKQLQDQFEAASDGNSFLEQLRSSGYSGIEAEGEALIRAGAVSPEEFIAAVIQ